jgi:hypothetical protein
MKNLRMIIGLFLLPCCICCTYSDGKSQTNTVDHTLNKNEQRKLVAKPNAIHNDEQAFRSFFNQFVKHLSKKDINGLAPLMNFPFYTNHQSVPTGMGVAADPITTAEFSNYSNAIFNQDVVRLLPASKDDNLSEIDEKTDEIYYKSLRKLTDPGSKLYEAYLQYPEPNNQAESYFGFVFGRVNGKFKVIASYAKWPIK